MIALEEPLAVEARNPDGIRVPFTATDIKALIGLAYASTRLHTAMLGRGCRGAPDGVPDVAGCLDVNAGAFHVALANLIGRQGQPFIAEIDPVAAVWNYPVQGLCQRDHRGIRAHAAIGPRQHTPAAHPHHPGLRRHHPHPWRW